MRLIGQGGMGEVYFAEDTRMSSHQVAIKVIVIHNDCQAYPDNSAWRQAEKSFQHEVEAIIQLDHPNILGFKDYGEQSVANESIMYMVMPYRAEGSLVNWLMQRGPVPLVPQDVGQMIMQAASALQHAHDRSIIHRDVKPANFLVRTNADHPTYPDLLLADFGIAKIMLATATTTRSMGTAAYMAPEQWNGDAVPASDQYALAVMTYQLLTGQLPFQGSPQHMMNQHFTVTPKPPSQLNSRLLPAIDAAILRALAKKADERFPTVKDFAVALQQALQLTVQPEPKGPSENKVITLVEV
jgi:serine/threonine protein kinase